MQFCGLQCSLKLYLGVQFVLPPALGQPGLIWSQIFAQVNDLRHLWDTYKSFSDYKTVMALWDLFTSGESGLSPEGQEVLQRPPLQKLKDGFGVQWRCTEAGSVSTFTIPVFLFTNLSSGSKDMATVVQDPRLDLPPSKVGKCCPQRHCSRIRAAAHAGEALAQRFAKEGKGSAGG